MGISRQNYDNLAAALKLAKPRDYTAKGEAWAAAVRAVANVLDDDNDAFARGTWEHACELPGAVPDGEIADSESSDDDLPVTNVIDRSGTGEMQIAICLPNHEALRDLVTLAHGKNVPGGFIPQDVDPESKCVRLLVSAIIGHNPQYTPGDRNIRDWPVVTASAIERRTTT